MQLAAKGQQDSGITAKPEITFFRAKYRRHTNFAIEAIEQVFNGTPTYGNYATATISRNGDLVSRVYLKISQASKTVTGSIVSSSPEMLGYKLIKHCTLFIGGAQIDRQYGEWMELWARLSTPKSLAPGHDEMVGKEGVFGTAGSSETNGSAMLFVPLYFWFCRNPGLALPLIALQKNDVTIRVDFNEYNKVWVPASGVRPGDLNVSIWVDYIYLDKQERRFVALSSHRYLIEQVQLTTAKTLRNVSQQEISLNFNHPVKEIVWGFKNSIVSASNPCEWHPGKVFGSARLMLNGHERLARRKESYFRLVQPFQFHTRCDNDNPAYVYSFALNPEDHQPSGNCNFTNVDSARLDLYDYDHIEDNARGDYVWIFCTNYNVLRVNQGRARLLTTKRNANPRL